MSRVLSAVAWPYANGPRHIGHVAGFGVPSDVFSRYMRMAGHDVLMVSGTDEHGTPILVAADAEGVSPRELADRNNRAHRRGPRRRSGSPTTCSPGPRRATTTRWRRRCSGPCTRNGYMVEQTTKGAISPSTGRTLPDRYIEGTCPICGAEGARGDQCDTCGNQLDPTELINPRSKINGEVPEFVETQHFFLDLPALADALREWLDDREASGTWRPERDQVQPEHPRGHPAARDDPRHRLGHPGPARGLARPARPSGSTCGSTRSSATCRPPSSGPGASASPTAGATGGTTRRRCPTTSWARTTSPSTPRSGPPSSWPTTGRGSRGGEPGEYGVLNLPTEVVSSEFLTMEGRKFSSSKARRHLRPRRARALPARRAALLHLRGRPGEPGQRLHLGGVRPAHQRRARRGLGQPGQPHRDDDREELRRDPRARAS